MSLRDNILETLRAYEYNAYDLWNVFAYRRGENEAYMMDENTLSDMFGAFGLIEIGNNGFDTNADYFWYDGSEWVSGDDSDLFNSLIDSYESDIVDDIIDAMESGDDDYEYYGFDDTALEGEYTMSSDETQALNAILNAKQTTKEGV